MVNFIYFFVLLLNNIIFNISRIKAEEIPNFFKFPFNSKIKSYSKTKSNIEYNEINFINDFLNNTIYINMSIGNPQQNVKVMLDPNDNCFTFNRNKEIIHQNLLYINNSNFTQVTPYYKNISSTAKRGSVTYFDFSSEFNDLYEMEDIFFLYQYSDSKNLTIKNISTSLRFLYGNNKSEEPIIYGKIGLDMNDYETSSCPRFFYSLGIKYLIKKYIYHFDFYSDFHGYFYLGPEPHLYNTKFNTYKEYQYIKMNTVISKKGYNHWNLLFNKIIIKNRTNDYIFYLKETMSQIDFNLGLIIGTNEYQQIIEQNFFNFLIEEKICKKTLVKYSYDKSTIKKYYIYKCDRSLVFGDKFDKKKYHPYVSYLEIFPEFELFHINFEHNFYISHSELFRQVNGDYYFKIIFEAENENKIWKFGQTFLKRYELFFDYDSKVIGYYDQRIQPIKNETEKKKNSSISGEDNDKKENNLNNRNNFIIIIYIALFIVFCAIVLIVFYLGMKFKESRKKRANELKDDDYEYNTFNNNSINNNIN